MIETQPRTERAALADELLSTVSRPRWPVRLLGIAMSDFELGGDGAQSQMMFAF